MYSKGQTVSYLGKLFVCANTDASFTIYGGGPGTSGDGTGANVAQLAAMAAAASPGTFFLDGTVRWMYWSATVQDAQFVEVPNPSVPPVSLASGSATITYAQGRSRRCATLGANSTFTLSVSGAKRGMRWRIVRPGTEAFTCAFTNAGPGGGTHTIASGSKGWVEFYFDGTDVIVRRARMQGFETLWLPGTDHAGIATEVVVGRTLRAEGIEPRFPQIDTLAGEFPADTNYLYATYHAAASDAPPSRRKKILILGSGTYRIGSSVEFDWCAVNAAQTIVTIEK